VASYGELRGKGRCGVYLLVKLCDPHMHERLRGEVLTTRRYINLRLPSPYLYLLPFDLIFIGWRGILIYYHCAKFGDFAFSSFGFIMQTNTQTYRVTHRRR